jgi:hypothetical protein
MSSDSQLLIGKVLGHKQASTTERYAHTTEPYAHLHNDPVRAVADRTARKIAAAMSSDLAESPVPIGKSWGTR